MAQDIRVPEVSDGVKQGTVISLVVKAGDRVTADQTLLEMETDKAVVAIPAPEAGVITEVLVSEGSVVKIGDVIMKLETGAAVAKPAAAPAAAPAPAPAAPVAAPAPARPAVAAAQPLPPAVEAAPPPRFADVPVDLTTVRTGDAVAPAAPSIRRLARELGVDIYQVQGTGPAGRISEDDVRAFVRATMQRLTGGGRAGGGGEFPGLHAQRPLPDFTKWGPIHTEPLSRVREITADAMGYAWSTIPMVTQYDRADITRLEQYRRKYNESAPAGGKLTMTTLLLKVCAAALKAFPRFNSSLDLAHKELVLKDYVHIGVAVDTPNGLLVPVIRDADRKGLEKLAQELNDAAQRTRDRKISPAEMEGGTFTISNLGGIGGTAFTPIVYAPQVAILGVSRSEMAPVWNGGQFAPKLMMPLSLTYDHRVIDGADGARFLRWICEAVEEPLNLVLKG
ncbi:MAG: 2-oxo acid dehydrogenase subunit E2 [bacterium]|nr:2-oxo acid dehydrogenase subunit E2 [bacterium]